MKNIDKPEKVTVTSWQELASLCNWNQSLTIDKLNCLIRAYNGLNRRVIGLSFMVTGLSLALYIVSDKLDSVEERLRNYIFLHSESMKDVDVEATEEK